MVFEVLDSYTGDHFDDPELKNVQVFFKDNNFVIEKDLLVVEAVMRSSRNDNSSFKIIKSTANKKLPKKVVVNGEFISQPDKINLKDIYTFEIFLDDFDYSFGDDSTLTKEGYLKIWKINSNLKYLLEEEKENFQKFEMDEFINKPGLDSLLDEDVCSWQYANIFNSEKFSNSKKFKFKFDFMLEHLKEELNHKAIIPDEQPSLDDLEDIDRFNNSTYIENKYEANEDQESYFESLIAKYNLFYYYELKHFYFVGLGVLLANIDNKFSISEKDLIEDYLLEELKIKRARKIINDINEMFKNNTLTMSSLIEDIRDSLYTQDKIDLVQKLYSLIAIDGVASREELLFLDKICESLNIDFQSIKDIKNKSLINIDIQIDEEDFSTLDIDFNLPILMQIQQAENELHLWNSRLNTLSEPISRANAQNYIDKYSEFIKSIRGKES